MTGRGDLLIAFSTAIAVHAGVLVHVGPTAGGGAGSGGEDRISVTAASPAIAALARTWDQPPTVAEATAAMRAPVSDASGTAPVPDTTPSRPGLARLTLPDAPGERPLAAGTAAPRQPRTASVKTAPARAPIAETAPTKPMLAALPRIAPVPEPPVLADTNPPPRPILAETRRPAPRPARPPSDAIAARVASGAGEAGTRGSVAPAPAPKVSKAARQAAASAWAAEIERRIARHHAYPKGTRDEGRVRVAMVILADGRLAKVGVARSSGSAALDKAAIAAVRRAAPFPAAPDSLSDKWYDVGQWIAFERR